MGVLAGSGSGKLLLFGEHAAVYGYEAVGITLPMSMSISVDENGANAFSGISENEIRIMESLFSFIKQEIEEVQHIPVGTWCITSTIPREAGFGSSAAVCAALSRIILSYNDKSSPSTLQTWHLANRIESFFHGTPSGIDTGLSILGGMHAFKPNPPNLPVHRPLSGSILHVVTGSISRGSNTKDLVIGIRRRMQSGCTETSDILRRLGDIAHTAILHLNTPGADGQKLEESIDEAHRLLGVLNLNHPDVSRCIASEKSLGALGGKISGAGNGGAFFLIYPSATAALQGKQRIRESLGTLTYIDAFTWRTNLIEHPSQS